MSKAGEYVPSPRPNPRLRPEGAAYAERNRGTMERWFDYSDMLGGAGDKKAGGDGAVAGSDGAQAPVGSSEGSAVDQGARTTAQVREEGGVGGSSEAPPLDQSMSDSMLGEGEALRADSRGEGAVDDVAEKCSELSLSSVRAPVQEAKEYAERNRGTMEHIINNYQVTSPPPAPSSQESAGTHSQGTETAPSPPPSPANHSQSARESARQRSLHQESQGRGWDETRPAPRIRPDGESIAMKNSTDSMFDIMRSDSSPQSSPVKTAQPARHSQESAAQSQAAGQPRARPGEGMKNYERAHDQSEMAAILRGEGDTSRTAPPRNIRHLQRSELW